MAKCLKCKKKIERLNVVVDERNIYAYRDGDVDFSHNVDHIEYSISNFRCPLCHEIIFEDQDNADIFLKK